MPKREFCERRGLPIIPVRPAIISSKEMLPVIPENIQVSIEPKGHTFYTLRLLRSGFLNIWDEMANEWINYFLTEEGYYYPLSLNGEAFPAILSGKTKPCANQPSELARASFITLPISPPPLKNGVFWFSWSETQWTESVRKKHEDASYRQRYMQRFDMDKWINTKQEKQTLPINKLVNVVAEYSIYANSSDVRKWSPSFWKQYLPLSGLNLIKEADLLANNLGAILVLQDPLGLTQEISHLIDHELKKELTERIDIEHEYFTQIAIENIKNIVTENAENEFIEDFKGEHKVYTGLGDYYLLDISKEKYSVKNQELKSFIEKRWEKYSQYYDQNEFDRFKEKFDAEYKEYEQTTIIPRVKLYLSWLQDNLFTSYFIHNFDSENIDNGIDYTATINNCIIGMSKHPLVLNKITEWLDNSSFPETNILSRALLLNQRKLIEKINEATKNNFDYSKLPWDTLLSTFEESMKPQENNISVIIGMYIGNISGAINNVIYKSLTSNLVFKCVVAMGALNNKAIVIIKYEGTYRHFLTHSVKSLINHSNLFHRSSKDWMRSSVDSKLMRFGMKGADLEQKMVKSRFVFTDLNRLEDIKNLNIELAEKVKKAHSSLLSLEEYNEKRYIEWQRKLTDGGKILAKSSGLLLGISIALIQFNNIRNSADYENKTLTQDLQEEQNRFRASITGLCSTILLTAEDNIKKFNLFAKGASRLSILSKPWLLGTMKFFGRLGGFAAGFTASMYDGIHAGEEFEKGNIALGIAYSTSAASSFLLIFMSSFPLVLIVGLLALFLISTIYIILNIQDKIQKWLERCIWRIIPDKRDEAGWPIIWPNKQIAVNEFKLALEIED